MRIAGEVLHIMRIAAENSFAEYVQRENAREPCGHDVKLRFQVHIHHCRAGRKRSDYSGRGYGSKFLICGVGINSCVSQGHLRACARNGWIA